MKKVCIIHQQLWYEQGYILLQGLWEKCVLYIINCGMNKAISYYKDYEKSVQYTSLIVV